MEPQVIQDENIQEQEQVIVYSKWNKLVIPSAEKQGKKYFNILKYGTALLLLIIGLISLWFAAQWQTPNVLARIGIDVNKWSNYLTSTDTLGNAELIKKISEFQLWDLQGSVLSQGGVEALVVMGIALLFSAFPLLIFKNGTAWSMGSIALSWVLLIIVTILFSLGLESQSNAIALNTIPLDGMSEIDKINEAIATQQSLIIVPSGNNLLTPQEQLENNKINSVIARLVAQKDDLLSDFMKTLNDYLILL
ncbi:MAG: hypothetical protein ACRC1F_01605 [Metamycoplasmataceae bacterium]